jgi:hypothetical protein
MTAGGGVPWTSLPGGSFWARASAPRPRRACCGAASGPPHTSSSGRPRWPNAPPPCGKSTAPAGCAPGSAASTACAAKGASAAEPRAPKSAPPTPTSAKSARWWDAAAPAQSSSATATCAASSARTGRSTTAATAAHRRRSARPRHGRLQDDRLPQHQPGHPHALPAQHRERPRPCRAPGLRLPMVYNCGGYEPLEIVRMLDGIVDIYLPDYKYTDGAMAAKYSAGAADYPEVAAAAIAEMHRQVGELAVDENGVALRGLMIRHLVLPENVAGTDRLRRVRGGETDPFHLRQHHGAVPPREIPGAQPPYPPCSTAAKPRTGRRGRITSTRSTGSAAMTAASVGAPGGLTMLDGLRPRWNHPGRFPAIMVPLLRAGHPHDRRLWRTALLQHQRLLPTPRPGQCSRRAKPGYPGIRPHHEGYAASDR